MAKDNTYFTRYLLLRVFIFVVTCILAFLYYMLVVKSETGNGRGDFKEEQESESSQQSVRDTFIGGCISYN